MNEGSLRLAVVGLGYWGPNLARNFAAISGCELAWLCDPSPDAREQAATRFPTARVTGDLAEVLADDTLDAVALATPVPTHADLAVRVLEAGKHCFVEKPLAQSVADAERAAAAADEHGRVLMVGHLLEYHPGVQQLKQLTESGELGRIYYIYSNRLNLGKLRADENALWSLGAHDVSVVLYLANEEPWEMVAHGESYVQAGVEDVVFCFLRFPSGLSAAPAPVVARSAQGAPVHGRRLAQDGDVRRHGARGEAEHLRQRVRSGVARLRRVHHPDGWHRLPPGPERRTPSG